MLTVLGPNYTNIPMDILAMPNPLLKCRSANGENPDSEFGTPATYARLCIEPESGAVQVVVKKGDHRLYETRMFTTTTITTNQSPITDY